MRTRPQEMVWVELRDGVSEVDGRAERWGEDQKSGQQARPPKKARVGGRNKGEGIRFLPLTPPTQFFCPRAGLRQVRRSGPSEEGLGERGMVALPVRRGESEHTFDGRPWRAWRPLALDT